MLKMILSKTLCNSISIKCFAIRLMFLEKNCKLGKLFLGWNMDTWRWSDYLFLFRLYFVYLQQFISLSVLKITERREKDVDTNLAYIVQCSRIINGNIIKKIRVIFYVRLTIT